MTRLWRISVGSGLTLAMACATPAFAQAPDGPPAGPSQAESKAEAPETPGQSSPSQAVPVTATDLARIRRALETDPAVRIDDSQLRFYMQILAKQPTFAEFARGYDFVNGPTRGGNPMSHAEFLVMVTPKELNSQVGITARETLEFALTNWLAQSLVKKAFEDLQRAKTEREIQDVRDRIERELQQLRGGAGR